MTDIAVHFDDTTHRLDKLRVKILFGQSGVAQFGALVVAALYVILFRHRASPEFLKLWTAALLSLTLVRFFFLKSFSRYHVKFNRDFDPVRWENSFALLTLGAGVLWGVAVCAAFPVGDLSSDSLMGYILAGVTAGAAVAYSASLKSIYCFFLPCVIPFAIKLALKGDEIYWGMAVMMFVYSLVFLKLTYRFNKYAMNAIALSFQKDQLIEKIRMMQSQVTQSAQMAALGRMAGGMAHEINNPLAIILGANQSVRTLLEQSAISGLSDKIPKFLASSDRASERIAKLVKELHSFAGRPGDEEYDIVSLAKVIEMAGNFCNERFKAHKISFTVGDISGDLMIECRPFHMTQVLLNLLNNSFDATSQKNEKWIRLEVVDFGEKVEIMVTDSGVGIPEEIRSKIMQPFFSTKEVGKGMGLGLSVSKGIIDSHQGALWLDIGHPNTRFIVSLPKNKKIAHQRAA